MKWLVRSFACSVLAAAAEAQVVVVYGPQAPPSTVIIEREPPPPVRVERPITFAPARQITYLLALKNNKVWIAQEYWVKGETLYYLTTDHQERTVPVADVDLTLTTRLNSERNVAFFLPAVQVQEKVVARSRVIRHTASVVHKRCYCTVTRSTRATSPATGAASRATPPAKVMTR